MTQLNGEKRILHFFFYYYKNNTIISFFLLISDQPLFKMFTGNSQNGKLVDVNDKYKPEAMVLFRRYKDMLASKWDEKTKKWKINPLPVGVSADSLQHARKNAQACNGISLVEYYHPRTKHTTLRYDDVRSLEDEIDIVSSKRYDNLIAFAKKIRR